MGTKAPEAPGTTNPAIGRSLLVRLLREFRPGVYVLDDPLSVPSECNFWEQADVNAGGCPQSMVGDPIHYHLYAVRIRCSGMWEGFDEPIPLGLSERQARPLMARNGPALSFSPATLTKQKLLCFLRHARRVTG